MLVKQQAMELAPHNIMFDGVAQTPWCGGGFSTVRAYLRDTFGTRYVGAIHGILLTGWSAAGIAGPVLQLHPRI